MSTITVKQLPAVLKAAPSDRGVFTAVASTDQLDLQGERVLLSAWIDSVVAFHEQKTALPILIQHDPNVVVGKIIDIVLTADALVVTAQLDIDTKMGRAAYEALKGGKAKDVSVGFEIIKSEDREGVRTIVKAALRELSIVEQGANTDAVVVSVKRATSTEDEKFRADLDALEAAIAADQERIDLRDMAATSTSAAVRGLAGRLVEDERRKEERLRRFASGHRKLKLDELEHGEPQIDHVDRDLARALEGLYEATMRERGIETEKAKREARRRVRPTVDGVTVFEND